MDVLCHTTCVLSRCTLKQQSAKLDFPSNRLNLTKKSKPRQNEPSTPFAIKLQYLSKKISAQIRAKAGRIYLSLDPEAIDDLRVEFWDLFLFRGNFSRRNERLPYRHSCHETIKCTMKKWEYASEQMDTLRLTRRIKEKSSNTPVVRMTDAYGESLLKNMG
jgi:hypothetical protein